ncbi:hypothetical protein CSA37_02465 [Candidatus Fermentibacteria bacterium]|nr:MAG: hypothetical protein CSA37_02465 [Candidatus Fermentibacteria bacterium]
MPSGKAWLVLRSAVYVHNTDRRRVGDNIIQVRNLTKRYGELAAVDNISFDAHSGEILGILGPNGSGKTTTIKSILGILKYQSGTITVKEMDPAACRRKFLRITGAVLEGARNIYWYLSPRENLLYFAGIRGFSDREVSRNIPELLEALELSDVADKEVRQFSSGMKQKCSIACAMVHDPEILILDEPTLGLDVETGLKIREWLRSVCEKKGKTILITSHDMDFIEAVCDRVLIIRKGKKIFCDSVDSLKEKFSGKFFRLILDSPPDEVFLNELDRIAEVSAEGTLLDIRLCSLSVLLPVLELIHGSRYKLLDLKSIEKNLEDIFLELVRKEE